MQLFSHSHINTPFRVLRASSTSVDAAARLARTGWSLSFRLGPPSVTASLRVVAELPHCARTSSVSRHTVGLALFIHWVLMYCLKKRNARGHLPMVR